MKLTLLLASVVFVPHLLVAQDPTPASDWRPPYERLLTGDDAARAAELQRQIDAAEQADD